MRVNPLKKLGVAFGVIVLATFSLLPIANGELVYDDDAPALQTNTNANVTDREDSRQVLNSAEKARTTVEVQNIPAPGVTIQAAAPVTVQPTVVDPALDAETGPVQNLSKSELLRRERMREELRNEDRLQTRLEELRLRDEQTRADRILGQPAPAEQIPGAPVDLGAQTAPAASGITESQVIVAPVTQGEHSIAQQRAAQAPVAAANNDQVVVSQAAVDKDTSIFDASDDGGVRVGIMPRGGVSSITGNVGTYDIDSRFTAGIGLNVAASENVSIDIGWDYSEFGLNIGTANPEVAFLQSINGGFAFNQNLLQTLALNRNLFEVGAKVHFLRPTAVFRPFVGAGGAYGKSFINYDNTFLNQAQIYNPAGSVANSTDFELDQWLGYIGGGFDVGVSDSITVGMIGKYYTVFSSNQQGNLNNGAFFANNTLWPYYTQWSANNISNIDKQNAVFTVEDADFFSILATIGFTF